MYQYAVIRADLNSSDVEILSQHRTEAAAHKSAAQYRGTTGMIGLYVAHRTPSGEWESRIEARNRLERA